MQSRCIDRATKEPGGAIRLEVVGMGRGVVHDLVCLSRTMAARAVPHVERWTRGDVLIVSIFHVLRAKSPVLKGPGGEAVRILLVYLGQPPCGWPFACLVLSSRPRWCLPSPCPASWRRSPRS